MINWHKLSLVQIHIETDYELGPRLVLPQVTIYEVGIASRHARLPFIPMHRWDYVPGEGLNSTSTLLEG